MVTFLKVADTLVQIPPPTPTPDVAQLVEIVELTTCKVEPGPLTLMAPQLGATLKERVELLILRCPSCMLMAPPSALPSLPVTSTRSSSRVLEYPAMAPPGSPIPGPRKVPPPSPPVSVKSVIVRFAALRKKMRLLFCLQSMMDICDPLL